LSVSCVFVARFLSARLCKGFDSFFVFGGGN
jgi:hypothetical protein